MNSVIQYLLAEDVVLDLEVPNKRQLFHAIGQHMRLEHALSAEYPIRFVRPQPITTSAERSAF